MIEQKAIDTLRVLSVEAILKASSGHPGMALGAAPIMHTLFTKVLNFNPKVDKWFNRDRFVMAAGHGSSLLYSCLHLAGAITLDDLKSFRSLNSITPGHPELNITPCVDISSGPLGQGIPEAVGFAIAESFLGSKYNTENVKVVNHYTYVLCGDGDMQEGATMEALSLAGHLGLNKLIVLYDSNDVQLDGAVSLAMSDDTKKKMEAFNWNYLFVKDGNDIKDIISKVKKAQKSDKPTLIEIKTVIGYGAKKAGTSAVHGAPLALEEVQAMRKALGGEEFSVADEVYELYKIVQKNGCKKYRKWKRDIKQYKFESFEKYQEFEKIINNEFAVDFSKFSFKDDNKKATRNSSSEVLKWLGEKISTLIGGTADLSCSTKAKLNGDFFSKDNRLARNIAFGVREHAMAGICNGMAAHGGVKVFCSGFFVFSDYMKPAMRLAALMELPVIYVFSHDSIAVGEDGPTHQPVEQLTMLRSIPNFEVLRPADQFEMLASWQFAITSSETPVALITSRQDLENVTYDKGLNNTIHGGYILSDFDKDLEGIIIASGSEVSLALALQKSLAEEGRFVRVVSMPSLGLFEKQSKKYKESVLPKKLSKRLVIEASDAVHYYKYLGEKGQVYNIEKFGKSANAKILFKDYGFDLESILDFYKSM